MRQHGGSTADEREALRSPTAEGDATATPTKDNEDEGGQHMGSTTGTRTHESQPTATFLLSLLS